MTPEQVKLVQDSFARIEPIGGTVASFFYDRLFRIAPDVRPLFPEHLSQNKKKRLIQTLAMAVSNLHQVEKIIPAVQDLGRRHAGYRVASERYEPVGAALLWALEQSLESAFTPQVRDAWTATYSTIADVMKAAAAEIPPKAEKNRDPVTKAFG
jgi:hemoglobin-like flavoprotein